MGCAPSRPGGIESTAAEKATNQAIEDEIRRDRAARRYVPAPSSLRRRLFGIFIGFSRLFPLVWDGWNGWD